MAGRPCSWRTSFSSSPRTTAHLTHSCPSSAPSRISRNSREGIPDPVLSVMEASLADTIVFRSFQSPDSRTFFKSICPYRPPLKAHLVGLKDGAIEQLGERNLSFQEVCPSKDTPRVFQDPSVHVVSHSPLASTFSQILETGKRDFFTPARH